MPAQFYEVEAPRQLSFGSAGGRMFSTTDNRGFSGWAQWNENWQFPLAQWTITIKSRQNPPSSLTLTDFDLFYQFFINMRGKARGFRFWAPGDNTGTNQAIGTGDGTTVTFQLQKTYSIFGDSIAIPITKPIMSTVVDYKGNALTDTVVVKDNGTPVSATVDVTTGQVTLASAPAAGHAVTADFQFHFPCHFMSDKWNGQVQTSYVRGGEMIVNVASMEIEEVRIRIPGLS